MLAKCIVKNISLMGNCLVCENDLRNTLNNFVKGKYDIVIDSVYTLIILIGRSPRFGIKSYFRGNT